MDWKDIRNSSTYKSASLMDRHSIRTDFFNEFIKTNPDFPQDEFIAQQIEQKFTVDYGEELDLPKLNEAESAPWKAQGDNELEWRLKRGSWGAIHALTGVLESTSFGLSEHIGLDSKGINDILTRKYNATPDELKYSKEWGKLGGYGLMLPALFEHAGGGALAHSLSAKKLVQSGTTALGFPNYVLKSGLPKWVANAAGWALTGFESGVLRKSVEEGYNNLTKENPEIEGQLARIGLSGIQEASAFAAGDLLFSGLIKGGVRFLSTRPGKALLSSINTLGDKAKPALTWMSEMWAKHSNPIYRDIAKVAKAEGKTFTQKMDEIANTLISEKNALKESYEVAKGRTWTGDVEIAATKPADKTVEVLSQFGKPASLDVARNKPGFMQTAEEKVALGAEARKPSSLVDLPKIREIVKLNWLDIPKTVAKDLPSEVIAPPTVEWTQKIVSAFPQHVVDQKSLEEVGNAIASEMGIDANQIAWKFKLYDKKYISAQVKVRTGIKGSPPHEILVRVPKEALTKEEVGVVKSYATAGSRGDLVGEHLPSQARIKKTIIHELTHITNPGTNHSTMFWDDVKYHNAATLIKREMRMTTKLSPAIEKPVIQTTNYKGYLSPDGVKVFNAVGEEIETFVDTATATRWITGAEKELTVKSATKKSGKITFDDLIDNPDLAEKVVANRSLADDDYAYALAQDILIDSTKITTETLVDNPTLAESILQHPAGVSPEIAAQARDIIGERTPIVQKVSERVLGKYNPDATYNVTYLALGGSRQTLMTGSELNAMNNSLNVGLKTMQDKNVVTKIVDVFPIKGESGQLNFGALVDAITDLKGQAEVTSAEISHVSKKFGCPFFIGQKYPSFKPVYMAIQNAVDQKTALFTEGMSLLNVKKCLKLPETSQAKVTNVIKLGNSPEVQKWYTPDELVKEFKLNAQEIEAYTAIQGIYKYSTGLEINARKIIADFDSLTPDQQAKAEQLIQKQVSRLNGYVSQTRFSGKFAVYVPPDTEGEIAKFFNLYKNKSDAERAAAMLGPKAKLYLKTDIDKEIYRHLTIADLENLIEAAGVDASDASITALRDVLKKRTFAAHWVHRQDVPGYEWNYTNIIDSAIEYMEGAANKYTRLVGRSNAEKAFGENVSKMPVSVKAYTRDFLNGYYNTGAIGIRSLNRLAYTWKLAFKTSWLAQNLTQPLSTTYPALAQYYKGLDTEKAFISAYDQARRYLLHNWSKQSHGLSDDLILALDTARKQGVLGDQMTRFMMGVRSTKSENFEKALGLFGRAGEAINRTHAAIAGYKIATDKMNLTDKDAILNFMKEFVYKTQFAFGKQNLPTLITGAGNLKSLLRTAYTFRHYTVNYMQLLNSMMPWRGANVGQTTRAIASLLSQAGIYGLPAAGLISHGYKRIFGRTLDSDLRGAMVEAHVPGAAIDMTLHGAYTAVGIDASNLIGMGDAIPTYGSDMEKIFGAAYGLGKNGWQVAEALSQGDVRGAFEHGSPDAIRNLIRAHRYMVEGVTKKNGEVIATPSQKDTILSGLGFTPIDVTKAYEAAEAKTTLQSSSNEKAAVYNEKIARAIASGNRVLARELANESRKNNRLADRSQHIYINWDSIYDRVRGMQGRGNRRIPTKLREKFRQYDELYGLR